ncbi:MAG: hypothetical protein PGN13_16445 [Patulibacter minatonensis]
MKGGRTTWWAHDAALHRREYNVELAEEFGPAGPHVHHVLRCWAQEQGSTGEVRGGFRALAREAFVDHEQSRKIVEAAATFKAIDDLLIEEDGRRFQCRISGWKAEQERGRAALRQADKRARDAETAGAPPLASHGGRDESPPVTSSALPDQTVDRGESAGASASAENLPDDEPTEGDGQLPGQTDLLVDLNPLIRLAVIDVERGSDRFRAQWAFERGDLERELAGLGPRCAEAGVDVLEVQRDIVERLIEQYPQWDSRSIKRPIVQRWVPATIERLKAERDARLRAQREQMGEAGRRARSAERAERVAELVAQGVENPDVPMPEAPVVDVPAVKW